MRATYNDTGKNWTVSSPLMERSVVDKGLTLKDVVIDIAGHMRNFDFKRVAEELNRFELEFDDYMSQVDKMEYALEDARDDLMKQREQIEKLQEQLRSRKRVVRKASAKRR